MELLGLCPFWTFRPANGAAPAATKLVHTVASGLSKPPGKMLPSNTDNTHPLGLLVLAGLRNPCH